MPTLRLVLGDQLSMSLSSLVDWQEGDTILMCEVMEEARYVPHHKKKLAFIFSAMRHFRGALEADDKPVRYVKLDDQDNSGSFTGELERMLGEGDFDRVVITEPGEYRVMEMIHSWQDSLDVPVIVREDTRFFASLDRFERWADGKKQLRMEFFYREMRRETGHLMDGDKPEGGQWNFDKENRRKLPKDVTLPDRLRFEPDAITTEVLALVNDRFPDNFGDLEPFGMPVTRAQALEVLTHFIETCLPRFGDYQDAMAEGEAFLFHSTVSAAMNAGLLLASEVCEAAETAYQAGQAPLNAVEGFIRQILGWREYVRGLYWLKMPDYKGLNALEADRPLPDFYWTGKTDMACLADAISTTKQHAYAHHIQRLMITGNFALLAGIAPDAINEWYMVVYADAYEWVELPNTHGMAIYADGGIMASKPYAASGAYIDKMSDHCAGCRYKVKVKNSPEACPFNYLYWDFVMRNADKLKANPRMGMIYRSLERTSDERRVAIKNDAESFFENLYSEQIVV
ncbi:cryptochrome/photolyase family protein [Ahrensia marina]|uniref:cryptochrome/photolyase family protein n=1 Tax=Ahrensia marina TaxID=1514904 RepID=UPI0035D0CEBB